MNNITQNEILAMLQEACRIVILTHAHPDGDAVGSAYAIKNAFPEKEIYVLNDDLLSPRLAFLANGERELSVSRLPEGFQPDLVMSVDVASLSLVGKCGERYAECIDLRIDHHATGQDFARCNFNVPHSASCGEVIFDLLAMAGKINASTALPLYGAICADTGCFRYSSVTAETYRRVAALVETGIDFSAIAARMVACRTQSEIRAIRCAYENLQFYCGGKVAVILFTAETMQANRLCDDDLGVVAPLPKEIDGVELSILIKQRERDSYKISMRSEPHIAANELCALFGGGGHRCAAGATVKGENPHAVQEHILQTVFAALEEIR